MFLFICIVSSMKYRIYFNYIVNVMTTTLSLNRYIGSGTNIL